MKREGLSRITRWIIMFVFISVMIPMLLPQTAEAASKGKIRGLFISGRSGDERYDTDEVTREIAGLFSSNILPAYSVDALDLFIAQYRGDFSNHGMTKEQFKKDIRTAFKDSTDDDLNIYYYTGHGSYLGIGPAGDQPLSFYYDELLSELLRYKGTFVVILETCGAGGFWTRGYDHFSENAKNRILAIVSEEDYSYTLAHQFSDAIVKGCNYMSGKLLADKNHDGFITVAELGNYLRNEAGLKFQNATYSDSNLQIFQFDEIECFEGENVAIDTVTMNLGDWTEIEVGLSNTDSKPRITWYCEDSSIVSVNPMGTAATLHAKKVGETSITAYITDNQGNKGDQCTLGVEVEDPTPAPQTIKKVANEKYGIRIYWPKSTKADGYKIYRKEYGSEEEWHWLKTITNVETTSYLDSKAENGKIYCYTVRGYCGSKQSSYNKDGLAVMRLRTPYGISKCVSNNPGEIYLEWDKNGAIYKSSGSFAGGYQISVSTNPDFSNAKKYKVDSNKTTLKNLVYGKKYYVKVQTFTSFWFIRQTEGYVVSPGAGWDLVSSYSSWSSVKTVTVMKPSVKLDKSSVTVNTGRTVNLKATVKGPSKKVTWKTSNSSVATVSSSGVVKGVKAGSAVITAAANGVSATCKVTVKGGKYIEIYKKFLEKGSVLIRYANGSSYSFKLTSFLLLDVNNDKIPELIVKNAAPSRTMCQFRVYSVKNDKIFFCGEYSSKTQASVKYNPSYKGILNEWWTNGVGGTGSVLYGLNLNKGEGNGIVEMYKAWSGYNGRGADAQMIYEIGVNLDKTSKAEFDAYVNKYFNGSGFKTYQFVTNTASNRNKMK